MKKLIAAFVLGVVLTIPVTVFATHGGMHYANYSQTSGPAFFPASINIRCQSWAEDQAVTLHLVEISPNFSSYQCHQP